MKVIKFFFLIFLSFCFSGGVVITPKAYCKDKKDGLGSDFIFSFFIGNFYKRIDNRGEFFSPIGHLFFGADGKYSKKILGNLFLSTGGIGYISLLGGRAAPGLAGGEIKPREGIDSYGYLFLNLSLTRQNFDSTVGLMYGNLKKIFQPLSERELQLKDTQMSIFFNLTLPFFKRKIHIEGIIPTNDKDFFLINLFIERFLYFNFSFFKAPFGFHVPVYICERFSLYPF